MDQHAQYEKAGTRKGHICIALLAILAPIVVFFFVQAVNGGGSAWAISYLAITYSCYPFALLGIRMWATGCGSGWINGVDWSKIPAESRPSAASCIGAYMAVGIVAIYAGLAAFMGGFPGDAMTGLILIIAGVSAGTAIILLGCVRVARRRYPREFARPAVAKQAFAVIAATALLLVPALFSFDADISVDVGDESVRVRAPMADFELRYADIGEIEWSDSLDKGYRVAGYDTQEVRGGEWKNNRFGKYTLAVYAKVDPCIIAMKGGHAYVFNSDSGESTRALYDLILEKAPGLRA